MLPRRPTLALLAWLAGQTACAADAPVAPRAPVHGRPGHSWTILVYLQADNDLEQAALDDLQELMTVGSTPDVHLVVQCDRRAGGTDAGVGALPAWTSAQRLRVTQGGLQRLADLGEQDLGDPEVLADFVAWGLREFPADRQAVVFWDHGAGARGFGLDETDGHDTLTLPELAHGLRDGMQRAGVGQLALVGFDACLMGSFEVAKVLQPSAEYLLASQDVEPAAGWDWTALAWLRDHPQATPLELGHRLIQAYAQQPDSGVRTLALTDLVALGQVDTALVALGRDLQADLPDHAGAIGQGAKSALAFGATTQGLAGVQALDLGQLAVRWQDLSPRALDLAHALEHVTVEQVSTGRAAQASGLSIEFPLARADYRQSYEAIEGLTAWRAFLQAWYAARDGAGAGPIWAAQGAGLHWTPQGWEVDVPLQPGAGAGLLDATVRFGTWDAGQGRATLLVQDRALVTPAAVSATWDGALPRLEQGTHSAVAYVEREVQAQGITLDVPLTWRQGGVLRSIVWRVVQAQGVQSSRFVEIGEGGLATVQPGPLDPLWPWLASRDPTGAVRWQSSSQEPFFAPGLALTWAPLPAGTATVAEVTAEALGGPVEPRLLQSQGP